MTKTLTQESLGQFSGTEVWYRHPLFSKFTYTEGVKYVADTGGAYWLIDLIFSTQYEPRVKAEHFQHWTLKVQDSSGTVTATDGNGHEIYKQEIEFTDFPLPEIQFYFTDNVLLLPGEY